MVPNTKIYKNLFSLQSCVHSHSDLSLEKNLVIFLCICHFVAREYAFFELYIFLKFFLRTWGRIKIQVIFLRVLFKFDLSIFVNVLLFPIV